MQSLPPGCLLGAVVPNGKTRPLDKASLPTFWLVGKGISLGKDRSEILVSWGDSCSGLAGLTEKWSPGGNYSVCSSCSQTWLLGRSSLLLSPPRNPCIASSNESPAAQKCPGSTSGRCTTHLTYVSSSRQPVLPKAGIDLGHLKAEEAKGSVNQWVWVKRSTEGPMPSPTHNCVLPFSLPFNSRERLDSALLPSLLDSAIIVLFSLDIALNEATTLMTSHYFHGRVCCHHDVITMGRCPTNIEGATALLKAAPGDQMSWSSSCWTWNSLEFGPWSQTWHQSRARLLAKGYTDCTAPWPQCKEKGAWVDLSSSVPQRGQGKDLPTAAWWWKADAEEQHAQEQRSAEASVLFKGWGSWKEPRFWKDKGNGSGHRKVMPIFSSIWLVSKDAFVILLVWRAPHTKERAVVMFLHSTEKHTHTNTYMCMQGYAHAQHFCWR